MFWCMNTFENEIKIISISITFSSCLSTLRSTCSAVFYTLLSTAVMPMHGCTADLTLLISINLVLIG